MDVECFQEGWGRHFRGLQATVNSSRGCRGLGVCGLGFPGSLKIVFPIQGSRSSTRMIERVAVRVPTSNRELQ